MTPSVPETEKGFVDLLFGSSSSVNPQFITSKNIKLYQLQPSLENMYYTNPGCPRILGEKNKTFIRLCKTVLCQEIRPLCPLEKFNKIYI